MELMKEYEKKKSKNDIELNIMLAIAILAIIIFVITMIITIINVYNKEKNNETSNVNQQENISNDSYNQENTEDITSNKGEQEIINSNINEQGITSNESEQETINNSNNDNMNFSNTNVEINTNTGRYSNNETIPFKLNGGKIVSGDLQTGLSIQDINGNEWVWIEVPKSITQNANTNDEIEKALEEYTKSDITGQSLIIGRNDCADKNYEGTGLTDEEYINKKNKMLNTIKNNGGFYIGKYETGYDVVSQDNIRKGNNTHIEYPINEKPLIKKNLNPYNWVNCKQAEKLAESLTTDGRTTSLLFGIQWDLVIKYLNSKGINKNYLIQDSTKLGNYSNNGNKAILKTGNNNYTAPMGIYDLAGNVWEWTLEKSSLSTIPSIVRGGAFNIEGKVAPANYRGSVKLNLCNGDVGFRCTLY